MLIRSIIFTCALFAAGGRFCGDYGGDNRVKFPDFTLAFTLGGIMLLTLFLMPHCFIVREKAPGKI